MILKVSAQTEYELIDSGDGKKLERFGYYTMARPDPEALWRQKLPQDVWQNADLEFLRIGDNAKWVKNSKEATAWNINYHNLVFAIKPTSFKHTGLFPEQMPHWEWMEKIITNYKLRITNDKKISTLNLFAYTGGATLACARAGAEVCHVDGSKTAVAWARENAELSGLKDAPIRWIVEDVILFLKREVKRGHKYDGIIMDPPSFGHGPKDELWKIEQHFMELMDLCKALLSDDPLFVLINGYTAGYSPIVYENNLLDMMENHKGTIEKGELAIEETKAKRLLPSGIFARWSKT